MLLCVAVCGVVVVAAAAAAAAAAVVGVVVGVGVGVVVVVVVVGSHPRHNSTGDIGPGRPKPRYHRGRNRKQDQELRNQLRRQPKARRYAWKVQPVTTASGR